MNLLVLVGDHASIGTNRLTTRYLSENWPEPGRRLIAPCFYWALRRGGLYLHDDLLETEGTDDIRLFAEFILATVSKSATAMLVFAKPPSQNDRLISVIVEMISRLASNKVELSMLVGPRATETSLAKNRQSLEKMADELKAAQRRLEPRLSVHMAPAESELGRILGQNQINLSACEYLREQAKAQGLEIDAERVMTSFKAYLNDLGYDLDPAITDAQICDLAKGYHNKILGW
jgi:hypothetical protein